MRLDPRTEVAVGLRTTQEYNLYRFPIIAADGIDVA